MDIKNLSQIFKNFLFRNYRILVTDKRTEQHKINLHWAVAKGDKNNVGDYLSTVVFEYLLKVNKLTDIQGKTKHLYAIGSIIDLGYQDATVWGSGFLRGSEEYWWKSIRKLDIRCVRGPETRRILLKNGYDCPEIYGDPAILMPLIYKPKDTKKEYDYRIVRHYQFSDPNNQIEINPMVDDWKVFINEIVKSRLIISSSLHGIILAEAYGVPAILLKEKDMNLFKYRDWYYSTGRKNFPIAESIEDALSMKPAPLPKLDKLCVDLFESFPVDLWE